MPLGERGSATVESPDAVSPLLAALAILPGKIHLDRIRIRCLNQQNFSESLEQCAIGFWRSAPPAHRLEVKGNWTEFYARLSASRRKQLRRKQRQAETLGRVGFRIVIPQPDSFEDAFETFLAIEDASWKGAQGVSLRRAGPVGAFFRRIGEVFAGEGAMCFYFLDIGGRPAAGQMALRYANRLWALKIGYDQAYGQCSPGLLLDEKVFEHCHEAGLDGYEFLGNADDSEISWSPKLRPFANCRIFPKTLAGIDGLAASAGASARRRSARLTSE